MSELSSFFNFAADIMCVLNAEGCCCQINPAFERALGYSQDELRDSLGRICDRPFPELAHPDDYATVQSALARLTSHQQSAVSFTSRHWCHAKDQLQAIAGEPLGTWRWLEWNASYLTDRIYCTARDVTGRREQENQSYSNLAKAEAETRLYEHTVHNMQVGLNIWRLEEAANADSLRLIATNPAAHEFTGIPMTEVIVGKTIQAVFPALAGTDIPQIYADVALTGQGQDLGEVLYEDSRVKKSIFSVKAFALPGQCVGVAFENITEKKQANIRLQQQKNDLIRVNLRLTDTLKLLEQRNQELDQFAYVTSHDLKAPLRAIANLATWLEEDLGNALPAANREQLDLLKSRVDRMEGLINGLLEYSRIGRTQQSYERIDVAELLNDIVDSILPLNGFAVEIAPNMPVLKTTKVPLVQLFSNLITNAIKHHNNPTGTVKISACEIGDFYEFSVADDGPGIDPAYHEKIFTIFQTLKSRDDLESTGIGLSLVKKIVTTEGGHITIDSQLGKGAIFRFTWPKRPNQDIS